jgi:hypothetical protein
MLQTRVLLRKDLTAGGDILFTTILLNEAQTVLTHLPRNVGSSTS